MRLDVAKAATLAEQLAQWVIVRVRSSRAAMIRHKSNEADFVTDIDLSVEMWVQRLVLETFPDHGFRGEEFGGSPKAYTWYCDPLDGTTNFANGIPWHSFSLALCDREGPLVGVVADPRTGDVFRAVRDQGATLNGSPLRVSPRRQLAGSVFLTEFLGARPWPGMFPLLDELGRRLCTPRIMGSSTLTITGLAAGRGHAAVIGEFGAVDLLAGTLIAHEAGLTVLDEDGEPNLFPERGGILVANPGLADELFALWRTEVARAGAARE